MRVSMVWLGALLLATAGAPTRASGPTPQPATASASATASVSASAPAGNAQRPSAPRKGPQDPMEFLRERLAAKLGNDASLDSTHPGMIRVVNRGATAAA
ncbi:MAG: hypothetical protein KDG44_09815, partial [Burkholderiaceae bacterium]|nr:hypothetical protein [Burkholderiaceae bacterium]